MTAAARYDSVVEAQVLGELRPRYEKRGYEFIEHPAESRLPAFMQGYRPDAIATNDRENIAIEVKGSPAPGSSSDLQRIRDLFVGHREWTLTVVYGGGGDDRASAAIPVVDERLIEDEMAEVGHVLANGGVNAALLMSFALLEAVARSLDDAGDRRPRRPATVVQSLAMMGFIDAAQESRLRTLAQRRNRIVHGDLTDRVDAADVEWLLATVRSLLKATSPRRGLSE